jgi:ribosomal protein S18 acetylase RimI-like enzyme
MILCVSAAEKTLGNTMVGQAIQQSQSISRGVRRFNYATDLNAVGHVLAEAFRPEHNMPFADVPLMHEFGIFLWTFNYAPGLGDTLDGFVWVENGKIVGNLSISRDHKQPDRLYISNVGVMNQYRRQGIARTLVQSAIDYAREQQAKMLCLNVRPNNAGAIKLYADLGFKPVETQGEWLLDTIPPLATPVKINLRPVKPSDDRAIAEMNLLIATKSNRYQPTSKFALAWDERIAEAMTDFFGMRTTRRWALEQDGKLAALVFLRAHRIGAAHEWALQVHPDFRGHFEDHLIAFVLHQLEPFPARPVRIAATNAYPELIAALERQDFRFLKGLTLMELVLGRE